MRCPRCRRTVRDSRSSCTRCCFDLRGASSRSRQLDLVTDAGPIGPLDDFVLREAPSLGDASGRPGGLLRTRRSRGRSRSWAPRRSPAPIAAQRSSSRAVPEPMLAFDTASTSDRREGDVDAGETDDSLRCVGRRATAWLIDATLLWGINLAVVYFTVRLASLSIVEAVQLPLVPLIGFFLLFDLGYLVVLTGFGGQTIGKMALGLRVERFGGEPVRLAAALTRTAAFAVCVLPAGLGLVGVFLNRKRTLHDRIANTRVVKVC